MSSPPKSSNCHYTSTNSDSSRPLTFSLPRIPQRKLSQHNYFDCSQFIPTIIQRAPVYCHYTSTNSDSSRPLTISLPWIPQRKLSQHNYFDCSQFIPTIIQRAPVYCHYTSTNSDSSRPLTISLPWIPPRKLSQHNHLDCSQFIPTILQRAPRFQLYFKKLRFLKTFDKADPSRKPINSVTSTTSGNSRTCLNPSNLNYLLTTRHFRHFNSL
ncbi:hypothetical protein PGT21_025442 [Puccinia graminis f. sp. tritici]|uniref:Uncharacterized protein n=1 Tax=Puccinia graminis f. sp. tritici TaxID=56615 RepID=A0A5B0LLK9_PUCGR|nr:hypothetical protein PGT21_025442 [Puccinia graminis f. sp. tritici]